MKRAALVEQLTRGRCDAVERRRRAKYQPLWPMTQRSPASYRHWAIPRQPNTSHTTISLTPAEARVLTLLATYRTLAAIGEELGIGRPTVKTHVQHIYEKLGANTRAGAVERAERLGWLAAQEERR
jgi:DNA-binding CsgD family transcriptional regulator